MVKPFAGMVLENFVASASADGVGRSSMLAGNWRLAFGGSVGVSTNPSGCSSSRWVSLFIIRITLRFP